MEQKYMELAIKEARKGIKDGHGGPFGAVIVKDDVIIAKAHNEVIKNNDPTCHGEMMAIHKACKKLKTFDLSGCEIYTTGEPCPMCLAALLWANIRKIYYGCNIEDTAKIGFRDSKFYDLSEEGNRDKLMKELSREDCLKLYDEYKHMKDKEKY
ncbi:MAG: nucleoside deaminase [Bacilli bacterium]